MLSAKKKTAANHCPTYSNRLAVSQATADLLKMGEKSKLNETI